MCDTIKMRSSGKTTSVVELPITLEELERQKFYICVTLGFSGWNENDQKELDKINLLIDKYKL